MEIVSNHSMSTMIHTSSKHKIIEIVSKIEYIKSIKIEEIHTSQNLIIVCNRNLKPFELLQLGMLIESINETFK